MSSDKHCRDCRNPVGPARTWCFECRDKKINVLLDMRLTAMTVPSQAHWLPTIDRWIRAVKVNNADELPAPLPEVVGV